MVLINEFLPNPAGKDTEGEFIELINTGASSAMLTGLTLRDAGGKTHALSGELPGQTHLVLPYARTKISINNNGEELSLYNVEGALVDRAAYTGVAPEGKSFARTGDIFLFTEPTPGTHNIFRDVSEAHAFPLAQIGQVVSPAFVGADTLLLAGATAALCAFAALHILITNR